MYVCMHGCMYVCMYVCVYVCVYVCMCVCVYIYIYTQHGLNTQSGVHEILPLLLSLLHAEDHPVLAATHRLHSSSFLGLPYRILYMNHKKELLWSL